MVPSVGKILLLAWIAP
jgi:hypothetical protein